MMWRRRTLSYVHMIRSGFLRKFNTMEQDYPPFASDVGGSMNPRQLNRWMDVSPQNGALQRTRGYIQLPVFSQAVSWKGYSELVVAFNFTGTRNFSLKDFTDLPTDGNYVLFIAYQTGGVVYRYKLAGDGGVFYFDTNQYTNQRILHNFRLEVWSVEDATVSETTARTIYTTALGSYDYRFAIDFVLTDISTTITDFQSAQTIVDLPYQADLMFDFRADSGYNRAAGTWNSRSADANQLFSTTTPAQTVLTDAHINGHAYIPITQTNSWQCDLNNLGDCYNVFFIFRSELTVVSGSVVLASYTGAGDVFNVKFSAVAAPSSNPTTVTPANDIGDYSTIVTPLSNNFYMLEIRSAYAFQYGLNGSAAANTATGFSNASTFIDQLYLATGRGIDLVELWGYGTQQNFNSAVDYQQLFKYVSDRYGIGRIPIPFNFPANSNVPNNT